MTEREELALILHAIVWHEDVSKHGSWPVMADGSVDEEQRNIYLQLADIILKQGFGKVGSRTGHEADVLEDLADMLAEHPTRAHAYPAWNGRRSAYQSGIDLCISMIRQVSKLKANSTEEPVK